MLDTGLFATAKGSWEVMDYNEFRGDLFSFGATIKLPVWSLSKNKYLQYKNSLQRQSIEEERKKFELTLKVELQTQIELWKAIDKRLAYMEKEHLNMLNQNLNSTLSYYQTGKVKYSEVVLSQIELLNLKLQIEELKAQKDLLLVSVMEMLGDFTNYLEGGN
jgi:outer membrane protein TolC